MKAINHEYCRGMGIQNSSHRVENVAKKRKKRETFRLGQGIVISSKVSLLLN